MQLLTDIVTGLPSSTDDFSEIFEACFMLATAVGGVAFMLPGDGEEANDVIVPSGFKTLSGDAGNDPASVVWL